MLKKILCWQQPIASMLLLSLLGMVANVHAYSFQVPQEQGGVRVSNVEWKAEGGIITISFALSALKDQKYKVSVSLLREKEPRFKLTPRSLYGHVGEIAYTSTNLQMVWDYKKDVPQGLPGDDYYFEITVEPVISGGSSWYYYVLGGVVAAGGTAVYLLGNGTSAASLTPTTELPAPPARPNQ